MFSPPRSLEQSLIQLVRQLLNVELLLNVSLSPSVFPNFYKNAAFEPPCKKLSLDHHNQKNYRTISQLSFMTKLLEKVVADQLTAFLENYIYDKFHLAFRKNHSTETALIRVSSDIMIAADTAS